MLQRMTYVSLISLNCSVIGWDSLMDSVLTLKWSLQTRMRSSKVVPGLKGVRDRISSRPQRPPCSVLHTMQGDRWKRGLKWNATSALGCTLLPQVKSTWNLEETQDITVGPEAEPSNMQQQQQRSGTRTNKPVSISRY